MDSLQRTWRKSLSLDWIPVKKARTFPLKEYYVGLRWARMVHRAIKTFKQELTNIYDILTIVEPSEEPKATNILVEGEKMFLYKY